LDAHGSQGIEIASNLLSLSITQIAIRSESAEHITRQNDLNIIYLIVGLGRLERRAWRPLLAEIVMAALTAGDDVTSLVIGPGTVRHGSEQPYRVLPTLVG
jgi:hypothetical protein